jgi:hypothetical protein
MRKKNNLLTRETLHKAVCPEALSKGIPRKNKGFDRLSPNGWNLCRVSPVFTGNAQ